MAAEMIRKSTIVNALTREEEAINKVLTRPNQNPDDGYWQGYLQAVKDIKQSLLDES